MFQDRKQPDCATPTRPTTGASKPQDLDHHRPQRLSRLPPCRPGLCHRTGRYQKNRRANLGRYRLRHHQPPPHKPMPNACSKSTAATGPSKTAATTSSIGTTTRTAAASAPATAREHHPLTPLRHRFDQVQGRKRRSENAPTQQKHSLGLRLPAHDRQLLRDSPCLISRRTNLPWKRARDRY